MQFLETETPPSPGMVGHGDGMSGMALAGGICAALLKRERTGKGSIVDGSLMGTAIWFNGPTVIASKVSNGPWTTDIPHDQRAANDNMYRTKDGRFLILAMLGDFDVEWADLCVHVGRPELATDPRFETSAARLEHRPEAVAMFDAIFSSRTLDEWSVTLATMKGVWGPIQTAREVHDDPQTIANGFLSDVEYPDGAVPLPVPPVLFDEDGGQAARAPDLGEHTDDVLRELGFDVDEITRLRDGGVIA